MADTFDLNDLATLDGLTDPIALYNGPVLTGNGLYRMADITHQEAKELVSKYGFVSAVGHLPSAQVFSEILGVEVPVNRVEHSQGVGQKAIALKLNIRPPEGTILSPQEMHAVGFSLKLIERIG